MENIPKTPKDGTVVLRCQTGLVNMDLGPAFAAWHRWNQGKRIEEPLARFNKKEDMRLIARSILKHRIQTLTGKVIKTIQEEMKYSPKDPAEVFMDLDSMKILAHFLIMLSNHIGIEDATRNQIRETPLQSKSPRIIQPAESHEQMNVGVRTRSGRTPVKRKLILTEEDEKIKEIDQPKAIKESHKKDEEGVKLNEHKQKRENDLDLVSRLENVESMLAVTNQRLADLEKEKILKAGIEEKNLYEMRTLQENLEKIRELFMAKTSELNKEIENVKFRNSDLETKIAEMQMGLQKSDGEISSLRKKIKDISEEHNELTIIFKKSRIERCYKKIKHFRENIENLRVVNNEQASKIKEKEIKLKMEEQERNKLENIVTKLKQKSKAKSIREIKV